MVPAAGKDMTPSSAEVRPDKNLKMAGFVAVALNQILNS